MTTADERRLNWAHSILNDRGSTEKEKRAACSIIARLDPEGFADHDDDPVRNRGMWD